MLKMLLYIFLAVILLALSGFAFIRLAPQIGADAAGERLRRMQASPNYRDGKFQNLVETTLDMPFGKMVESGWKVLVGMDDAIPSRPLETVAFDAEAFAATSADSIAVSWFGHSTTLIRLGGKTFLTDPVFSDRASMVSFIGPKRFSYTHPTALADLPPIDAILLSHDHYDHLDYEAMQVLRQKVGRFIVPLGVGAHLEKWGVPAQHITELDWWETTEVDGIKLVCAPARHFSGRGVTGQNETLWCSWVMESGSKRVYYGGDSGYYPGFKTIGEKYGPFDLALLECGAYNENWAAIHMMPEETAQAAVDLGAKALLPIHWAKFHLAMHTWRDPIRRLTPKAAELNVPLLTPRPGERVVLDGTPPQSGWWETY